MFQTDPILRREMNSKYGMDMFIIHNFIWRVIIHPHPIFIGSLAKPPLRDYLKRTFNRKSDILILCSYDLLPKRCTITAMKNRFTLHLNRWNMM